MKFVFWLSLIWIIYAYAGYLAILMLITLFRWNTIVLDEGFRPRVTMIIAAYNEEKSIEKKIKNCIKLNYPKDKLEIIIASDASTDRTDEVVSRYADKGIKLIRMKDRGGKTAAQNYAVKFAKGEILVFSDATTIYTPNSIRNLVRNFVDPKVGCAGGEEHFVKSNDEIIEEAVFFWKYETAIRRLESDFNTMIGVSGCIFAIRKELYESLEETLIEDFALPLKVASKGFKVAYEREAIGYEKAAQDTKSELSRKVRIVTGGINVISKMNYLLNPIRYPKLSFQIISHKICRWLAPVFIILLFISNLFLVKLGGFYFYIGVGQIAFYLLALWGYLLKSYNRHVPVILKLIHHFIVINFSAILGIIKFLKGEKRVAWETVR